MSLSAGHGHGDDELGEHNAELLAELGLHASELDALERDGVIGGALGQGA